MTIKKQFYYLGTIIILIPLICSIYMIIYNYIRSPNRMLIKGTKEIEKFEDSVLTEEEKIKFQDTLKNLPPDVDFLLLDDGFKIVISRMEGFTQNTKISSDTLWRMMSNTSNKYFYQITPCPIQNSESFLITRVVRRSEVKHKRQFVFSTNLIFLLFFIVFSCTVFLFYIFQNISKSITILKEQTQKIADGNLSVDVTLDTKIDSNSNEISSLSNNIETMRNALIKAQQQKNTFIMGMSHDLRTPVAVIKGYTEAISDGVISDENEIKQSLDLILTKTNQLQEMIDTLINYTKLESQNVKELIKPESITEIITNFATESKNTGNVFKRNIITEINFKDNIIISLNKQLVLRALENIFSNALRYTKDNDTISIISYTENKNVIIKIKDTGCGMTKDEIANIFTLFYRGTASRREEGIGIGLSVVKNIIDSHGWDIKVESELNKGTSFIITIPYNA